MNRLISFVCAILVLSTSFLDGNGLEDQLERVVNTPIEIYPKTKSLFSKLGIVNGVRQCGGSGQVLEWREEACTVTDLTGLCVRPAEMNLRGEVTFVPTKSSESLGAQVLVKDGLTGFDLTPSKNFTVPNSAVEAGKVYVIGGEVSLSPELRGKVLTVQLTIYRESDKKN